MSELQFLTHFQTVPNAPCEDELLDRIDSAMYREWRTNLRGTLERCRCNHHRSQDCEYVEVSGHDILLAFGAKEALPIAEEEINHLRDENAALRLTLEHVARFGGLSEGDREFINQALDAGKAAP